MLSKEFIPKLAAVIMDVAKQTEEIHMIVKKLDETNKQLEQRIKALEEKSKV